MMKMSRTMWAAALALALAACLAGCGRNPSLAEMEKRGHISRLYDKAMKDYESGRTEDAIRGFQRVVMHEPDQYKAHFMLAVLLQDIRGDYIGAISHYRYYLNLRTSNDTATVAMDRAKLAESQLRADVLRKAGGSLTGRLTAEKEKLAEEKKALTVRVVALENELSAARKQIDKLARESEMRRALLAKLSAEADGVGTGAKKLSTREALAELRALEAEDKRRRVRPTDAELLDDDEPSPAQKAEQAALVKKLREEGEREERAEKDSPLTQKVAPSKDRPAGLLAGPLAGAAGKKPARPERPKTYTVQEGDTLRKISTRFYGTSTKWREIQSRNRAVVPHNGSIRAGMVLNLP